MQSGESNLCPTCHKPTNESSPYREMQVDTRMVPVSKEMWLARMIKHDTVVRKTIKRTLNVGTKVGATTIILGGGGATLVFVPYYLGLVINKLLVGHSVAADNPIGSWAMGLLALITVPGALGLLYLLLYDGLSALYRKVSNIIDNRFPSLRQ